MTEDQSAQLPDDADEAVPEDLLALIAARLVEDADARLALEDNPIAALTKWGIDVPEDMRTRYQDATLQDIYVQQFSAGPARAQAEAGLLPAVLVAVATRGTRPATNTRSRSATKTVGATVTATATATATKTVVESQQRLGVDLPSSPAREGPGMTPPHHDHKGPDEDVVDTPDQEDGSA